MSADPQFDAAVQKLKDELHRQRESTTLFRRPVATLYHFLKVVSTYGRRGVNYLAARETLLYGMLLAATLLTGLIMIPGPHQSTVLSVTSFVTFAGYWLWLGVLSSIGLGTGLHTFVLYTGPYIMKTAFNAATCGTFTCAVGAPKADLGVFDVMREVALVACLWGAGTAIGELPPYFVSRAAAQSGKKLAELEEVEDDEQKAQPSAMDRVKLNIFHALQKWGFWAIVACASIPNPLFDLAGITCGHFGVPFWTFFGATFIGKAIIKVSLQSAVVIWIADPTRLQKLAKFIESIITPLNGRLSAPLEKYRIGLLHPEQAAATADSGRGLAVIWDLFLVVMIGYFVVSIINSLVSERLAIKDQATVEKYKAEYYLKRDAGAAAGGSGSATPIASPAATPVASPAVSRTSSRTSSPAAPKSRSPSGVAVAPAPDPAPAAAADAAAATPTAVAAEADGDAEPARVSRRTSSAAKRQGSAAKLTRGKSKSKVTEEDDAAVAASFTPQRLTRSASRTTRSSTRKLT